MTKTWRSVLDYYDRNFMWLELCIAACLALSFWLGVQWFWSDCALAQFLKGSRQPVYASIVSLSASLLGFVIAAVPIIHTFGQSSRMKRLRESNHYRQVFRVFFQAMYWLSFAVIGGIVAIIFDKDDSPHVWATYVMAFLLLAVVVRVSRCVWVLRAITDIIIREPNITSSNS
jgi:hypothetical protein